MPTSEPPSETVSVALIVTVAVHERNLRALRCCVTDRPGPTLHHCHGGSLKLLGWHVGMGQRQNPFLQIPLAAELHCFGPEGVDAGLGVESWEAKYGTQLEHLEWVRRQLDYDVFALAECWERAHRGKSMELGLPPESFSMGGS